MTPTDPAPPLAVDVQDVAVGNVPMPAAVTGRSATIRTLPVMEMSPGAAFAAFGNDAVDPRAIAAPTPTAPSFRQFFLSFSFVVV